MIIDKYSIEKCVHLIETGKLIFIDPDKSTLGCIYSKCVFEQCPLYVFGMSCAITSNDMLEQIKKEHVHPEWFV